VVRARNGRPRAAPGSPITSLAFGRVAMNRIQNTSRAVSPVVTITGLWSAWTDKARREILHHAGHRAEEVRRSAVQHENAESAVAPMKPAAEGTPHMVGIEVSERRKADGDGAALFDKIAA